MKLQLPLNLTLPIFQALEIFLGTTLKIAHCVVLDKSIRNFQNGTRIHTLLSNVADKFRHVNSVNSEYFRSSFHSWCFKKVFKRENWKHHMKLDENDI